MKSIRLISLFVFLGNSLLIGMGTAHAQDADVTPTATESALVDTVTPMPTPTATTQPTAAPQPAGGRPQIIVAEYQASETPLYAGSDFDLKIRFRNNGSQAAQAVTIVFAGDNFYLRETGGVWAIPSLGADESFSIEQPLTASWSLAGYTMGATTLTASYAGADGTVYNDTFSISVPIYFDADWDKPTPTPVLGENPQVVVRSYATDSTSLKPGVTFTLELELANLGSRLAKGVRMGIAGSATAGQGASSSGSTMNDVPFAVLDSSNLIHVGDLMSGETRQLTQRLIVDVHASAGVYTLPLSFQYTDENGEAHVDDQGITLVVDSQPQLKISFYENPGDLQLGLAGLLPIQVTNMGYQTALLGDLRLTSAQGALLDDLAFIGPLESGGSFALDAEIIPTAPGDLEVQISVDYNDAFGNPQQVVETLQLTVVGEIAPPATTGDTAAEALPGEDLPQGETFWQKVAGFFKTLLGFGN